MPIQRPVGELWLLVPENVDDTDWAVGEVIELPLPEDQGWYRNDPTAIYVRVLHSKDGAFDGSEGWITSVGPSVPIAMPSKR